MQASAQGAGNGGALAKLGFASGQVIQELGWDDDVDEVFRGEVEQVLGTHLEDEGYAAGADGVLLWFREEDGDLVDTLVDALTNLVDRGFVVLCTPRSSRAGHVEPSDIEDAAMTAGLHPSGAVNASRTWSVLRLVAPRGQRR